MSTTGIVLCGGRSMRMGRDKAALPFGDETLLARVVRLVATAADHVIVVGHTTQALPAAVGVEHDDAEGLGPLAGLARGLRSSDTDLNFVTACDMPLLRPAVIRRLFDLIGDADACVPVDAAHAMVLCGVYRRSLLPAADALIASGQLRLRALADGAQTKRVDTAAFRDIDPHLDSFFSCDTPEAYQQALVRLKADTTSA